MHAANQTRHQATSAITVAIADGDPFARHALRRALEDDGGFRVVAEPGSGLEAIETARAEGPDLVVMDLDLPGLDAIEATRRIAREVHGTRVMLLATAPDDTRQYEALWAGATGVLAKDTDVAILPRVLRSVAAGEAAVSREFAMTLIDHYRRVPVPSHGMRPVQSPLTEREWEILDLLAIGASTRTISARLALTPNTVYTHVGHILRKLGVHSRAEAVTAAERMRHGAGPPEAAPRP